MLYHTHNYLFNSSDPKPLVSVLMSVYKEPIEWLRLSIESILNQTYKNIEFIIINDNPNSEEHQKILDKYKKIDNRVKITRNECNIGLTKSLNIGLKQCKGKYIARMDADDISMPNRITKQVLFMESNPEVIVCGTKIKLIGTKRWFFYYDSLFSKDIDIKGQMTINTGFAHPSVIIRKQVLDDNNITYDENFLSAQDYKLWYDLRNLGKFANLKDKLLKYRISDVQVSSLKNGDQFSKRLMISEVYKKEYLENTKFNPSSTNNFQKIKAAYLAREKAHSDTSFRNLFRFLINNKTAATYREKCVLVLCYLYKFVKKHL